MSWWIVVSTFAVLCFGFDVHVDFNHVLHFIDQDRYIGTSLDTVLVREGWEKFDFRSKKVLQLARGLAPCYFRFGGTSSDAMTFDPNASASYPRLNREDSIEFRKDIQNFTLSRKDWDRVNEFAAAVGWDLIFGFNARQQVDNRWDPTNALLLLNYSASMGYQIAGFELGNEPDIYPHKFNKSLSPVLLAKEFQALKPILLRFPQYKSSLIIGPDVTRLEKSEAKKYLKKFLISGGADVVDRLTFHHYYMNGRIMTIYDFLDPTLMDQLKVDLTTAWNMVEKYTPGTPVWLGETSSGYGSGEQGLGDAYVAGFMWLDKLGLSAKYGVQGIIRQAFYHGDHCLLNRETLDPTPDYWLTVLYKRLVGSAVFNVTSSTDLVRVYAHCTNTHSVYGYQPGGVTIYVLNLGGYNVTLNLQQFKGKQLHIYWLTPAGRQGLQSKEVELNGREVKLTEDDKLPPLPPNKTYSHFVQVPIYSFGFVVIPEADIELCMRSR